jgi:hypothetical protein
MARLLARSARDRAVERKRRSAEVIWQGTNKDAPSPPATLKDRFGRPLISSSSAEKIGDDKRSRQPTLKARCPEPAAEVDSAERSAKDAALPEQERNDNEFIDD